MAVTPLSAESISQAVQDAVASFAAAADLDALKAARLAHAGDRSPIALANREIGALLHISTRTVDTHRSNILKKLGVKSNAELVKIAIRDRKSTRLNSSHT